MVASKYLFVWGCTHCEYKESTIAGPLQIKPLLGILKSKIETRWCNNCNGIRKCFMGKGHDYIPGEEPNSKALHWRYKDIDEIKLEILKINNEISKLENQKKSQMFFSLSKEHKNLKRLYEKLPELKINYKLYFESLLICKDLSKQAHNFYNRIKPLPKCLSCGNDNISNSEWNYDRHKCGGSFIRKNADIRFSVTEYELIQYNEHGQSIHSMLPVT